ncbi:hypothetical protein C8R43DRAFT_1117287 [Mycena crocata]|nr:hypothetical protein C8R43DRAFT_1117287 [Mycena crocata]
MDSEGIALSAEERILTFVDSLPYLSKNELGNDDSCPICLSSFDSLLADSVRGGNADDCGVTKLGCGHIFCRKDLLEWIRNLHGSCPTCRYEFLDIHPPGSDDESSDGGEYIPNEEDEDEEDIFIDTSDGFTDADFDVEDMDVDFDDLWERSDGEEMRISGEFEPSSEGDNSIDIGDDGVTVEVNVSVAGTDDQEAFDDSSDETQAEEPK